MYSYNKQLILEDGSIYKGYGIGSDVSLSGEIVFNTSMTGYQESISDPSYNNQIIVFTYPLIGNYGISKHDFESFVPSISGIVVKELCNNPSNHLSEYSLDALLKKFSIPGIAGVDTRSLTKRIRNFGTMKACITDISFPVQDAFNKLKALELSNNQVSSISTSKPYLSSGKGLRVIILDLGMKSNIVRELHKYNCDIIVMPYNSTVSEIENLSPDGIILSNGPGDPMDIINISQNIKNLINKFPIFGICMGHQILSLACGAKTYKLTFGHRGSNQPVKNLLNNKIYITSQNHGYAVDIDSLKNSDLELTHIAVNDKSCEGVRHKSLPVFSVQFHPEASPGPHDSSYLFNEFINNMLEWRKKNGKI